MTNNGTSTLDKWQALASGKSVPVLSVDYGVVDSTEAFGAATHRRGVVPVELNQGAQTYLLPQRYLIR